VVGGSAMHAVGWWLGCSVVWSVGASAVRSCVGLVTRSFARASDSWLGRSAVRSVGVSVVRS